MLGRRSREYSISSPKSFPVLWCCGLSDRLFSQESKYLSRMKYDDLKKIVLNSGKCNFLIKTQKWDERSFQQISFE